MKEPYYVYNNEAISSLILMSVVKQLNTIDIARLFLILPCLLDDRFVNYVARTNNQSSFSTILKEKANLFQCRLVKESSERLDFIGILHKIVL